MSYTCHVRSTAGYRGTSLIRKHPPLGTYSRPMPRAIWGSWRDGLFLMSEVPLYLRKGVDLGEGGVLEREDQRRDHRDVFIDNLLVRVHFIIVMIRWTGLAPWAFEFHFPGSLTSTFLGRKNTWAEAVCLSERMTWLIDSCITQLKAQGPSRTYNDSKEEEEENAARRIRCQPHNLSMSAESGPLRAAHSSRHRWPEFIT